MPTAETLAIIAACIKRTDQRDDEAVEEASRLYAEAERFLKEGPAKRVDPPLPKKKDVPAQPPAPKPPEEKRRLSTQDMPGKKK